ncbi:prepilin-type N-terminal cleavage/methylation domain-containing protein [Massilia sp. Mn16-1_5]|uniref:type IV pilus modification PilV family protein n=1 Tax=Massilia sp. Mn16-1_5 TaxID=2079199 RepID=UPI002277325D|nr:prepilin-type N-terminal cleavage/methylation domain-containing protein [Massilia sp. Mn16-1_5]
MKAAVRQHGFSFIEVMVAVLLLAICVVPMAEAVRNGLSASSAAVDKAQELRCMKNSMETILAEPYQTLWSAAVKDGGASYVLPEDTACARVVRSLALVLCEQCAPAPVPLAASTAQDRLESAMLSVSLTSDKGYSFTTLVAR